MKINYELSINKSFTLKLISNPSSGYSWEWVNENPDSLVKKVSNSFSTNRPNQIGSSGFELWEFKAIRAGTQMLKFEYKRSWSTESSIESKEIIIHIK